MQRVGELIHRIVFSVWWAVVVIIATIVGLIVTRAPWLVMLTLINIYQLWILSPLGWGDRFNDRKLDMILARLDDLEGLLND